MVVSAPSAVAASDVDFDLPSVYGGKIRLSDFRGRVVLLDFFATWCRPCKDGIPKLNKLNQDYSNKGLSVVGFSLDTGGMSVVKPFAVRNNMEFPIVMGDKDLAIKLGQVKVLPTTLVIDPQGRVVERFEGVVGEDRLLAAVRPYLSDSAPAAPTAAMVRLRQPNESRFTSVYVEDNHELGGARGLAVYVRAEVTDLVVEQGLWLRLDLRPEGKGAGPAKSLYQRIDDGTKNKHVLFVRCDQLPAIPAGGGLKASLTILNSAQKPVEKSMEVEVPPNPCQYGHVVVSGSKGERDGFIGSSKEGDSTPAWGNEESSGRSRFQRIWATDDNDGPGKPGLAVHVLADLSDLKNQKAIWMQLNLQPEAPVKGSGMTPVGESKSLYVRVDDYTRQNFQLFVRCDQLPKLPEGGAYRAWLCVLGSERQQLEKSSDFVIPSLCQVNVKTR